MRENWSTELVSDGAIQEFICEVDTDPVRLAEISKKSRRPVKRPRWFWWSIGTGAVVLAFVVGLLIGHFAL